MAKNVKQMVVKSDGDTHGMLITVRGGTEEWRQSKIDFWKEKFSGDLKGTVVEIDSDMIITPGKPRK